MFVAAAFYDLLVLCVCTLVRISVCVLVLGLIHMKKLRHFVAYDKKIFKDKKLQILNYKY